MSRWHNVDDIQVLGIVFTKTLQRLMPQKAGPFMKNDRAFQESLEPICEKISAISSLYAGTLVGVPENTYLYFTVPLMLQVATLRRATAEETAGKICQSRTTQQLDELRSALIFAGSQWT